MLSARYLTKNHITVDETENCELDNNKVGKFIANEITESKNLD